MIDDDLLGLEVDDEPAGCRNVILLLPAFLILIFAYWAIVDLIGFWLALGAFISITVVLVALVSRRP